MKKKGHGAKKKKMAYPKTKKGGMKYPAGKHKKKKTKMAY